MHYTSFMTMVPTSTKGKIFFTAPLRLFNWSWKSICDGRGTRNGNLVHAAHLRYVVAAIFLSAHPKFCGDVVRTGASAMDAQMAIPSRRSAASAHNSVGVSTSEYNGNTVEG